MLKRHDSPIAEPDSLGGLFGRAKDEARVWVEAEVALYKTIGTEKAKAWRTPAIMLAAALFLGHAALLVLVATLFVALAQIMNPALAGLVSVAILAGAVAIVARLGIAKLKGSAK